MTDDLCFLTRPLKRDGGERLLTGLLVIPFGTAVL